MGRVVWSDEAMENAAGITGYVRGFSPAAAARLESEFADIAENLGTFPELGRPIGGRRREVVVVRPFVLRYVIIGEEVRILSIRHSARRPPG